MITMRDIRMTDDNDDRHGKDDSEDKEMIKITMKGM
jgi:hypothetical protein